MSKAGSVRAVAVVSPSGQIMAVTVSRTVADAFRKAALRVMLLSELDQLLGSDAKLRHVLVARGYRTATVTVEEKTE